MATDRFWASDSRVKHWLILVDSHVNTGYMKKTVERTLDKLRQSRIIWLNAARSRVNIHSMGQTAV